MQIDRPCSDFHSLYFLLRDVSYVYTQRELLEGWKSVVSGADAVLIGRPSAEMLSTCTLDLRLTIASANSCGNYTFDMFTTTASNWDLGNTWYSQKYFTLLFFPTLNIKITLNYDEQKHILSFFNECCPIPVTLRLTLVKKENWFLLLLKLHCISWAIHPICE